MSTAATLITAEEFARMSFDTPVELLRGEIVEMTSPGGIHGGVCLRIAGLVDRWIRGGAKFKATSNDSGVLLDRNPDTVRSPDILIIQTNKLPQGRLPTAHFTVAPDVAIEVKSPSDRWKEIIEKTALFLAAGVSEVWVIDPETFHVHIYRADDEPTILTRRDVLFSTFLPGFEHRVEEIFDGIE